MFSRTQTKTDKRLLKLLDSMLKKPSMPLKMLLQLPKICSNSSRMHKKLIMLHTLLLKRKRRMMKDRLERPPLPTRLKLLLMPQLLSQPPRVNSPHLKLRRLEPMPQDTTKRVKTPSINRLLIKQLKSLLQKVLSLQLKVYLLLPKDYGIPLRHRDSLMKKESSVKHRTDYGMKPRLTLTLRNNSSMKCKKKSRNGRD